MNNREFEKVLKEHGYRFHKNGTRHFIWTNGKEQVLLSKGRGEKSHHCLKKFLSKMKRARLEMDAAAQQPQMYG